MSKADQVVKRHHVKGTYYGVPYAGVILSIDNRPKTKEAVDVTIRLDEQIKANGIVRSILLLRDVDLNTGTKYGYKQNQYKPYTITFN